MVSAEPGYPRTMLAARSERPGSRVRCELFPLVASHSVSRRRGAVSCLADDLAARGTRDRYSAVPHPLAVARPSRGLTVRFIGDAACCVARRAQKIVSQNVGPAHLVTLRNHSLD